MAGVDWKQGFTPRDEAFVVLAVAPRTSFANVGAFHNPTLANGREAYGRFGTGLNLDAPCRTYFR